ncbi:unnamed protein product [Phytomonas sp. Hart1]|nr:unnamed protein product [Phytomonas sp. Hart1]|eukprot:CCW71396.1 unnamed protein product [Phytomonas sp. isolate Hart1]
MPCQADTTNLKFMKKGAVFGSGAFGTAMSTVLGRKCEQVKVWHLNADEANLINEKHENVLFLKGVPLAKNITFTADVEETYRDAEIILFVIPTPFMRKFLKTHGKVLLAHVKANHVPVVVCTKGIEQSTLKFPAQILMEYLPGVPISVLAGPSFAIEVAKNMLTNVTVASDDLEEARRIQRMMSTPDGMFRCWAGQDTVGCEVASAVKNVLAIASGAASGLGMSNNARAALISRGLIEIRDLTQALGGNGQAIFGLAGLGDLTLTCSSELSRNFTVGKKLGNGMTMTEIMRGAKAFAEGVATSDPLFRLAEKLNVSMPLCKEVYLVVHKQKDAKESLRDLMKLPIRDEGLPSLFAGGKTLSKL